jgi:hypothetical protein
LRLASILCCTILSSASLLSALPYNGSGTYTVGGGGQYATLSAFGDDFTALTSGMTGDTTISIVSNLTETTNTLLAAPTNGFKLVIKPAPTVSPLVTFQKTSSNGTGATIWEGQLVVGPAGYTDLTTYKNMPNVEIDGSNTIGGTTRDMTFTNASPGPTETVNRCMVRFVGDTDNAIVRNLIVDSVTSGSSDNLGIDFMARHGAAPDNADHVPDNCQVRNCFVRCSHGVNGVGVRWTSSGTIASGTAATGAVVRDSEVRGSVRAIFFNFNAGGTVENTVMRGEQQDPPLALSGTQTVNRYELFRHQVSNGTSGWTVNLLRNRVDSAVTWDSRGVNFSFGLGGGVATGVTGGTYNVYNNSIAGYAMLGPSTQPNTAWLSRGISIEYAGTSTYNIYHNSINLPNLPLFSAADTNHRLGAFSINVASFTGTINFQNNIVRQGQANGTVISTLGAVTLGAGAVLNFNNNTYFTANGSEFASINPTSYANLGAWQARPADVNSNTADPLVGSGGGKWVSGTDLHFDADPGATFQTANNLGVTVDIDNQVRPNGSLEKGADEFYLPSAVSDWSIY